MDSVSILFLVAMATGMILSGAVGDDESTSTEDKLDVNGTFGNLTLEFDSGDLAFERENSRHKLIITRDSESPTYRRFVECRGENIKSLSATVCESMDECEKKKACLFDKQKCGSTAVVVKYGRKCTIYDGYGYSTRSRSGYIDSEVPPSPSTSTCFKVLLSYYSGGHSGIVQCTSEESGLNVTTFDHFNIGNYNNTLLSNMTKLTSELITMNLYVSSLVENLNDNSTLREKNVTLFADEEVISLVCQVPKLIFHKNEGLIIRVYRKDGSAVKLAKEMTSITTSDIFLKVELTDFRVPTDMVAFSCSAQRTNSSGEWLEKRIPVTVTDLPSELILKSSECKNMTVNLTSGSKVNLHCELTGPNKQKTSTRSHMRKMANSYSHSPEAQSTSLVELLRFHQVAREHLICKGLDQDYSSKETSPWKMEHKKYYGEEQKDHFIFNLAPSMPKIYKPSSSIHLIYQEDHVVDQTLFCMFKGEPEPVITWMKNGEELFSMKSISTRYANEPHLFPGNETMEYVKLALGAKTIEPGDFENSGNGHVNFSCIARNHFGSDRLDFIIRKSGESIKNHSEKPKSTTTTTEKSTTTAETIHSTTPAPSSKTTKNSVVLPSATTENSTPKSPLVTIEPREAGNSNSNLNLNSNPNPAQNVAPKNEKSQGNSKTILFLTIFVALIFICLLILFLLRKKRNLDSGRILPMPFQNHSSNDPDGSMRNVLLNDNPHENL